MKTDRLLLVDGSNLLFQMFFGMPARIYNREGRGIWGVIGFTGALLKIAALAEPTHIAVFFDGAAAQNRLDIDEEYKANRPDFGSLPDDENPYSQIGMIFRVLDYLKIAYAETTECEVDDWIASYVRQSEADTEIIISSFDSDFFQLLSEKVTVLRYRGEKTVFCTPDWLMEKYGIQPSQYADWKSMTGDKADNIVGLPKVGPKTASGLLNRFGSISRIYENLEEVEKKAVRDALSEGKERLRRNQDLICLEGKAALPFGMEKMRKPAMTERTTDILRACQLQ